MADRMFHPLAGALEQKTVHLYGTITIGSTGAVSASSGKGIASIVRSDVGKYTITLSDAYNSLLWADAVVLDDTDSDPVSVGIVARLFSQAVSSAKTVVIQFYDFTDGSPADPADGALVMLKFELKNSSV